MRETGYLNDVIKHFGYSLKKYDSVNSQIIEKAKLVENGPVPYNFSRTYDFGGYLSTVVPFIYKGVIFSLGDATVEGSFNGYVRREQDYLVINGIMNYEFTDKFSDPFDLIEFFMWKEGINRAEAEKYLGDVVDEYGTKYEIKDKWQTKFNATVKLVE